MAYNKTGQVNNIRKLRKEHRLTQIGLQMKTGIDQALISKYEVMNGFLRQIL